MNDPPAAPSTGYGAVAGEFMRHRHPTIGVATVQRWARAPARGGSVLELGCGHGEPITRVLWMEGLDLYAVDASPKLVSAFRRRFPHVPLRCEPVQSSDLFAHRFTGVLAWGLPPGPAAGSGR